MDNEYKKDNWYPIKILLDEEKQPFVPFVTLNAILMNGSEKNALQYVDDTVAQSAEETKQWVLDQEYITKAVEELDNFYDKRAIEQIIKDLGTLQRLMGRVDTKEELPNNPQVGDTWIVGPVGSNASEYLYTANGWEELGPFIDLSGYSTTEEVEAMIETAKRICNEFTTTQVTTLRNEVTETLKSYVKTVGGKRPDVTGNVDVDFSKYDEAVDYITYGATSYNWYRYYEFPYYVPYSLYFCANQDTQLIVRFTDESKEDITFTCTEPGKLMVTKDGSTTEVSEMFFSFVQKEAGWNEVYVFFLYEYLINELGIPYEDVEDAVSSIYMDMIALNASVSATPTKYSFLGQRLAKLDRDLVYTVNNQYPDYWGNVELDIDTSRYDDIDNYLTNGSPEVIDFGGDRNNPIPYTAIDTLACYVHDGCIPGVFDTYNGGVYLFDSNKQMKHQIFTIQQDPSDRNWTSFNINIPVVRTWEPTGSPWDTEYKTIEGRYYTFTNKFTFFDRSSQYENRITPPEDIENYVSSANYDANKLTAVLIFNMKKFFEYVESLGYTLQDMSDWYYCSQLAQYNNKGFPCGILEYNIEPTKYKFLANYLKKIDEGGSGGSDETLRTYLKNGYLNTIYGMPEFSYTHVSDSSQTIDIVGTPEYDAQYTISCGGTWNDFEIKNATGTDFDICFGPRNADTYYHVDTDFNITFKSGNNIFLPFLSIDKENKKITFKIYDYIKTMYPDNEYAYTWYWFNNGEGNGLTFNYNYYDLAIKADNKEFSFLDERLLKYDNAVDDNGLLKAIDGYVAGSTIPYGNDTRYVLYNTYRGLNWEKDKSASDRASLEYSINRLIGYVTINGEAGYISDASSTPKNGVLYSEGLESLALSDVTNFKDFANAFGCPYLFDLSESDLVSDYGNDSWINKYYQRKFNLGTMYWEGNEKGQTLELIVSKEVMGSSGWYNERCSLMYNGSTLVSFDRYSNDGVTWRESEFRINATAKRIGYKRNITFSKNSSFQSEIRQLAQQRNYYTNIERIQSYYVQVNELQDRLADIEAAINELKEAR